MGSSLGVASLAKAASSFFLAALALLRASANLPSWNLRTSSSAITSINSLVALSLSWALVFSLSTICISTRLMRCFMLRVYFIYGKVGRCCVVPPRSRSLLRWMPGHFLTITAGLSRRQHGDRRRAGLAGSCCRGVAYYSIFTGLWRIIALRGFVKLRGPNSASAASLFVFNSGQIGQIASGFYVWPFAMRTNDWQRNFEPQLLLTEAVFR